MEYQVGDKLWYIWSTEEPKLRSGTVHAVGDTHYIVSNDRFQDEYRACIYKDTVIAPISIAPPKPTKPPTIDELREAGKAGWKLGFATGWVACALACLVAFLIAYKAMGYQ